MRRLLSFLGATTGGWIGWWAGNFFGFAGAAFASLLGTAAGVFLARWISNEYLDIE